jgi:uncharacterized protein (DUF1800 family)
VSRRGLLVGGAATSAAAVAVGVGAGSAEAAAAPYLPPTRPYRKTAVPARATRHLVDRFSYGLNRPLYRDVRRAGGPTEWFDQQLRPSWVDDPFAAGLAAWYPTLSKTPLQLSRQVKAGELSLPDIASDLICWTLLRRIYSRRQLHEVMTEFWLNHLHVYLRADFAVLFRRGYDAVVRRHALGRFDEMLAATTFHPAMLMYLDGDLSRVIRRPGGTVEKINENLGRELLELHTVGRQRGYDESDVRSSAHILTGWQIDRGHSWAVSYDKELHWSGRVSVLDFTHANTKDEGREVQRRYLHYLAHHPATARRIARKLAVRFVSDDPSDELVNHLAGVFRRSGTDIGRTLRALVRHPEFARSAGSKVRTPVEDVVATHRVLGTRFREPRRADDAAHSVLVHARQSGQEPFGWPRPDGYPDSNAVWSSTTRFLGSLRFHRSLAGGYAPKGRIVYRTPESWLPQRRIRFDQLVDHLCRVLLNRPSTPLILGAACIATDVRRGEVIDAEHRLVRWRMPTLLATLLDTPAHMTR